MPLWVGYSSPEHRLAWRLLLWLPGAGSRLDVSREEVCPAPGCGQGLWEEI